MQPFSLNYENISRRLTETVIPDYGRRMDSTRLKQRGEEIKRKFSVLNSWPPVRLAEAELYREDVSQQDIRISRLSVPDFLTLLFDPYSRAQWDDFILKHADQAGNTSGPENDYRNMTGERSQQPERPQYGEPAMPEAWRDVIAERQRQINSGRTPEHDDEYINGALAAYSALFDHGLASKSDQRFASIRSTGNLTFLTAF
ncbi:hypothetical protein E2Q21_24890 [Salmonella enterica subsp. enterica serovar Java]|uniref:Uncharacterized protein n=5 Tax=Salmonella enterica TaxID=28901 RepID=A0A764Z226_SALER|nr:hypothetical protein [Salmonella enterica subsp. enterica serovar Java]EAO5288829.1 hypothetical protein [Salmonella enterica]ECC9067930.1 hypothetical protein [Salmonella enterica subsp. diarizonae]ECM6138386.1 hypothetical protein [Salmonella enterica subsp. enterica serovar Enteritidis]EDE6687262.1 hypothetical protein [Salmonella enterica subsp. enterica serovar Apeyeme]EDX3987805.1 hypothetical protein [Salmonella enterica subsp. enterica serovar 4,[5],12:b:-]